MLGLFLFRGFVVSGHCLQTAVCVKSLSVGNKIADGFDEVDLVIFKLDKVTVMSQNLDRDFPIPTDALERLINEFEDITEKDKEFFDNIFVVDKHDLTPVIEQILK